MDHEDLVPSKAIFHLFLAAHSGSGPAHLVYYSRALFKALKTALTFQCCCHTLGLKHMLYDQQYLHSTCRQADTW